MLKNRWIIVLFCLSASPATGQRTTIGAPPLEGPTDLSGTFAELRPGHFHSGIDMRTGEKTGWPVRPAGPGSVSRIKVRATGFGHAVYIDHPGSVTSVYAHLSRFSDTLQAYVLAAQLERRSFEVDLLPAPGQFPVLQDHIIGYSGNTGGSEGPHLHFELRDTDTQEPIDPMPLGYRVRDTVPPQITGIRWYRFHRDDSGLWLDTAYVPAPVDGPFGINGLTAWAVEVTDHMGDSSVRLGVKEVMLRLDGQPVFRHRLDRFNYGDSRFARACIDYAYQVMHGRTFLLLYKLPGNAMRHFDTVGDGYADFSDRRKHKVRITVTDHAGLTTDTVFDVKFRSRKAREKSTPARIITWDRPFVYADSMVRLEALETPVCYQPHAFDAGIADTLPGLLTPVFRVGSETMAVHKRPLLGIRVPAGNLPVEKMLIVSLDTAGVPSALGSAYADGWVSGRTGNLGRFALAIDTVPPVVEFISQNADSTQRETLLTFHVADSLSGIDTYDVEADGRWTVGALDAKSGSLTCRIPAGAASVTVTVVDAKGNSTVFGYGPGNR